MPTSGSSPGAPPITCAGRRLLPRIVHRLDLEPRRLVGRGGSAFGSHAYISTRVRRASAFAKPVQIDTARVLTESDSADNAVVRPTLTGVAAASAAAVISFSLADQ